MMPIITVNVCLYVFLYQPVNYNYFSLKRRGRATLRPEWTGSKIMIPRSHRKQVWNRAYAVSPCEWRYRRLIPQALTPSPPHSQNTGKALKTLLVLQVSMRGEGLSSGVCALFHKKMTGQMLIKFNIKVIDAFYPKIMQCFHEMSREF